MTSKERAKKIGDAQREIYEILEAAGEPISAEKLAERFESKHHAFDKLTVEMAFASVLDSGMVDVDRDMKLRARG